MTINLNSLPKVLVVDLAISYGGSSSRVLSLMAKAIPGSIALAGIKSGAVIQEAQQLSLPVHIVGNHRADPRIVLQLIRLIREQGFQILDTQNIQSKFWGSIAAKITNTTLISTINSWYANEHGQSSIKGKIYTTIELLTNWGLDLYITVSEKDRQSLLHSKISPTDIELIYNAVEVDTNKISINPDWLQNKFNLPVNSLICTAIGRLVPVKGYDILIEAIHQIIDKIPNLVCLIVGKGECEEALFKQIKEAGLANQIRLVGFQDRETVLAILNSSDIFVMPSRYEGTPIALLEAAALGCPIVASASGGIPELVTNNIHALLVEPNNPTTLGEGILRLSTDRQYAHFLGKNAQQKIQNNFSIKSQVQSTWNAYQKAWNKHNKNM